MSVEVNEGELRALLLAATVASDTPALRAVVCALIASLLTSEQI